MALLQWHIVTKNEFNEGVKQDGHIYFIKDTKEIYRGEQCFTEAVELYDGIDNNTLNFLISLVNALNYHNNDGKFNVEIGQAQAFINAINNIAY